MTGPPTSFYEPFSPAIGLFSIGQSPIGSSSPQPFADPTQTAFSFWQTVISQYANSPILTQILQNMSDCLIQGANIELFFENIFNIDMAQGYGLDLWGRILGVSRVLTIATSTDFGFAEASPPAVGFGQAPFFAGVPLTSNFSLPDASFRTLLLAKALANITNGTIQSLNQLLINLFPGRGNAFVTDLGNMQMTYTFHFRPQLTPVELAIVQGSGVLPKPVGVALSIVQL